MKFKSALVAGVASLMLAGCNAKDGQVAIDTTCQYLPAAITIAKLASVMFPGVVVLELVPVI